MNNSYRGKLMANDQNEIAKIYQLVDQTTAQLQKFLNESYTNALSENLFNWYQQKTFVEDGFPTPEQVVKLNQQYQKFNFADYPLPIIKKAVELNIVKAQKTDQTDVNHLMSPDIVGTFCALIIAEIFHAQSRPVYEVVDPCVGTGNLLLETKLELQKSTALTLNLHGLDNDDVQLALADSYGQLLHDSIDLYHQDAIAAWMISDCDLALSDLPVGYYPLDNNALDFQTKATTGHSYAHHLLMEQTMNNLRAGGIGIFIVPAQIFETEQATTLAQWMVEKVFLQAVLTLPPKLFASKAAAKSLIVLQKHGPKAHQASPVLMGTLPDLQNKDAVNALKHNLQTWSHKTFNEEDN